MRPKAYPILLRAIEEGVTRGYREAVKHLEPGECPHEMTLHECICDCIVEEICEVFDFSEFTEND